MGFIIGMIVLGVILGGILLINLLIALVKGTVQNIVTADAIIVAVVIGFLVHGAGLHTVFSILIGIAAGAAFFALTKIPYFGKVFLIIFGLIWAFGVYEGIDSFGLFYMISSKYMEDGSTRQYIESEHILTMLFKNDPIWWWTIVIILVAVFVGLHLRCVLMDIRENADVEFPVGGSLPPAACPPPQPSRSGTEEMIYATVDRLPESDGDDMEL